VHRSYEYIIGGALQNGIWDLDIWKQDRKMSGDKNMAILIYAPEAIKSIQPSKNKTNSFSNGFHMFLDKRLIHPSLLAVFQ